MQWVKTTYSIAAAAAAGVVASAHKYLRGHKGCLITVEGIYCLLGSEATAFERSHRLFVFNVAL